MFEIPFIIFDVLYVCVCAHVCVCVINSKCFSINCGSQLVGYDQKIGCKSNRVPGKIIIIRRMKKKISVIIRNQNLAPTLIKLPEVILKTLVGFFRSV